MKKYTMICLMALLAISCKKKPTPILTVGDSSGLIVTEHNIELKPNLDAGIYTEEIATHLLDLDQDGNSEITFESFSFDPDNYADNERHNGVRFTSWNSDLESRQIILPEIANSGDWYAKRDTVYDTVGTLTRKTVQETFTCNKVDGSNLVESEDASVASFTANEDIFSFTDSPSDNHSFSLYSEAYQNEYWDFSITVDSLVGYRKIKEQQCEGLVPFNQLFYIPFKITYDDSNLIDRMGWIELRLKDKHTLEILRSAISYN